MNINGKFGHTLKGKSWWSAINNDTNLPFFSCFATDEKQAEKKLTIKLNGRHTIKLPPVYFWQETTEL